jgi:hypothetical protein
MQSDFDFENVNEPNAFTAKICYGILSETGELLDFTEAGLWRLLTIPRSRMPADSDVSESDAFQAIKKKLISDISKRYPLSGGNRWVVWLDTEGPGGYEL